MTGDEARLVRRQEDRSFADIPAFTIGIDASRARIIA
jgi:hypothetical protein